MEQNRAILNDIYKKYNAGEYTEASLLVEEILKKEPTNSYALKYNSLINSALLKEGVDTRNSGRGYKIRGKVSRCGHCSNKLRESDLSYEKQKELKEFATSVKESFNYICSFCSTENTISKNRVRSRLGLNVGKVFDYKGFKYKVAGYVKYSGIRQEERETGPLEFIEWNLISNRGEYLYISESVSDGEDVEFSESFKVTPSFNFHIENEFLLTNSTKSSYEKAFVTVVGVSGENTKKYKIGEKVVLHECEVLGKNYAFELEKSGKMSELGIYESRNVGRELMDNVPESLAGGIDYSDRFRNIILGGGLFLLLLFVGPQFAIISGIVVFGLPLNSINKYLFTGLTTLVYTLFFLNVGGILYSNSFNKVGNIDNVQEGKYTATVDYKTGFTLEVKSEKDKQVLEELKMLLNSGSLDNLPSDFKKKIEKYFKGNTFYLYE